MLSHLVVHSYCRRFVDTYHHRLADKTACEEMPHDIFGHSLQTVITRKDVILSAQFSLEPGFLFRVELCRLNEVVNVLVQFWIDELQLGRAVLVEKRNGCAV